MFRRPAFIPGLRLFALILLAAAVPLAARADTLTPFSTSASNLANITVIGLPNGQGWAYAINDTGQIVGEIDAGGQNGPAYLDDGGQITELSQLGATDTAALGINNLGTISGTKLGAGGFIYAGGVSTPVNVAAGTAGTQVNGINDAGQVVGRYSYRNASSQLISSGFVDSSGQITPVNLPGATSSSLLDINNLGQVAGAATLNGQHVGFFGAVDGPFTVLTMPGAAALSAAGINDSGQIVGSAFLTDGSEEGFLYSNGTFTTYCAPGARYTEFDGINNSGQIVGEYVASPVPEPATLLLLGTGLLGLGVSFRRRLASSNA